MNNQMPDDTQCTKCSFGPPAWNYMCDNCKCEFEMPAPKGPTEERKRACPECGSMNIKVTSIHKSEACAPGG